MNEYFDIHARVEYELLDQETEISIPYFYFIFRGKIPVLFKVLNISEEGRKRLLLLFFETK